MKTLLGFFSLVTSIIFIFLATFYIEGEVDKFEFVIYGALPLFIVGIFLLWRHDSINLVNLYFKRKKIEQQQKIDKLLTEEK